MENSYPRKGDVWWMQVQISATQSLEVKNVNQKCRNCKFRRYCETRNVPCILEEEPTQVIENLEYCPKCNEIVETTKYFSPTCFVVVCNKCGSILKHIDTFDWRNNEK